MNALPQKKLSFEILLWSLIVTAAIISVLFGIQTIDFFTNNGPSMVVALLVIFSWCHGFKRFGIRNLLVFVFIVFITGNFYENLSVMTTFPFGPYHYTDNLGLKFIFTPLVINIAYFQIIYLAWNLSGAVIGYYRNSPSGWYIIFQPLIAMFITVMWDIAMDPYMSTIAHNWEWHNGGAYFGVPISNFYGWYLCTFTMLIAFSLYMSRQKANSTPDFVFTKINWLQITSAYMVLILGLVLLGIFNLDKTLITNNGKILQSRDILLSTGLISIGTMLFVEVLVLGKVYGSDELEKNRGLTVLQLGVGS